MDEKTKLVKISPTTDEKLKKLGQFGETYDQLINRIIETCKYVVKEEKTEKEPAGATEKVEDEIKLGAE